MGLFKSDVEKMKEKGDVEGLINSLKHKDWRVRWDAAEALGQIGDARAVEPLIKAFESIYFLDSKFKNDTRIQKIETGPAGLGLRQGMVCIAWVAVPAVAKIGKPAVDPLIQALKNDTSFFRMAVIQALGLIGDAGAIEPLAKLCKDKDKDVSQAAKAVLGKLKP